MWLVQLLSWWYGIYLFALLVVCTGSYQYILSLFFPPLFSLQKKVQLSYDLKKYLALENIYNSLGIG